MREVNGNDLLGGSDHEFVVNLYTLILNRWPDEDGYRHHLLRVENRPEMRRQLIDEIVGSPEGQNLGMTVVWPGEAAAAAAPPVPPPAPAAPTDLAGALAQLRSGLATMEAAALAEAQRLLNETLAAIAAHQVTQLEARIARLEQRGG
ncbi:DUF4214 domain-containing protein [Roseomonas terrae]|jgi:hypothetical protein|uniref:DUF4214 domain-containing protein n=1 Tax=Neoroseomonas terrae TaxID=424799 RepID=A0ABS5EN40_9PROT|nr:DUF4214 domain-containing protein [Neoroseomonas terrae]MBR0652457.1 DUF4214 domain-containing protein [Neoroseomonas terrae]